MKKDRRVSRLKSTKIAPSLWVDHSAEPGIQLLAVLNFVAAELTLNAWIKDQPIEDIAKREPAAIAAMSAVKFCQPLISPWINNEHEVPLSWSTLSGLIQTYAAHDFSIWLHNFQNKLLQLFAKMAEDLMMNTCRTEQRCTEEQYTLIALLCQLLISKNAGLNQKSKETQLLLQSICTFPKDGRLNYLLAEVYFRQKKDRC